MRCGPSPDISMMFLPTPLSALSIPLAFSIEGLAHHISRASNVALLRAEAKAVSMISSYDSLTGL